MALDPEFLNMGSRCRLCAEYCEELLETLEDISLPGKIEHLFQVKIVPEDHFTYICAPCHQIVLNTWDYSERVHKAQEILLEAEIASETISCDPIACDPIACDPIACDPQLPQIPDSELLKVECVIPVALQEHQSTPPQQEVVQVQVEPQRRVSVRARTKASKMKMRKAIAKLKKEEDSLSGASDAEINEDGSLTLTRKYESWDDYPWSCCDCQQHLLGAEDLREHHLTTHGHPPKYACADCPKIYTKYSMFLTHARVHRSALKFCCDTCGKWFSTSRQTDRHRSAHGDERPHGCATCGKRFRMQSALLVHTRSHLPAELKNRYQCDQCPKRFGTKPNLMAHKRIHAGVRDYTCDQCGKSFVQKGNLDNHLLTHTAARPFSCQICGKTFKTLVRLRKHGSVHSGLKPHQCDVCGRQFRERGTLKEHHRIHTGAMPFTCEFCGKSFRFKGVLTTHRRQHTGERPYSCFECQHHFTNWPNYNKHMKRRHGINTSVTVRKPQTIPPTGMPQRNPPGTILAAPDVFTEHQTNQPQFYPVLNLYNLPEELLQQRV